MSGPSTRLRAGEDYSAENTSHAALCHRRRRQLGNFGHELRGVQLPPETIVRPSIVPSSITGSLDFTPACRPVGKHSRKARDLAKSIAQTMTVPSDVLIDLAMKQQRPAQRRKASGQLLDVALHDLQLLQGVIDCLVDNTLGAPLNALFSEPARQITG